VGHDAWLVWTLIVGMAVATFFVKAVFVLPGHRLRLSPTFERILRYAPAAALMAIIAPELAMADGAIAIAPDNPRLLGGLAGFVIAVATRNIVVTIAGGMLVMLAARWLAG
jgi:branched-subunit amino acid transport protein